MELTREQQLAMHRSMVRIRLFEEAAGKLMETGKMPGFGTRTEDRCQIPPDPGEGGPPVADCVYPAILTPEQIAAIVAYERSL